VQANVPGNETASHVGRNSLYYMKLARAAGLVALCLVLALCAAATAAVSAQDEAGTGASATETRAATPSAPAPDGGARQDGKDGSHADKDAEEASEGKDGAGGAPAAFVPVYLPQMAIFRASGAIQIDGLLDDAGWKDAAKAGNFAEHNPGDQTKPEVDTEVMLAYDDANLYVAWLCYDDPDEVRATFCERDDIFSDDYVILCIDTFGEGALAYEIAANPYGIPGDLLYSAAYGEDITYDMIFDTAARITDFGWVVEMAIPFESMRFPAAHEQEWRVDLWRNRPRESRFQYSWAAYDRDEDCWPCQWGTINGITGVKPGTGVELLPALVAHQSGFLNDDGDFRNDNVTGDLALGISCDISSELTAEATINPDFSQVESDVAQLDVNTTFALFYPERRPFFQEGSDLFNTYFTALYTRSINDPLVAGKSTWRKGRNSVAYLSARDDHSVIILPFEESSEFVSNGKSYSNIVRARHDFGNQSHLGFVGSDRRFDTGGSGTLAGLDGQYRFSPSNGARFQVLASHTEEVNNPSLVDDEAFNAMTFDDGRHTARLDGESYWGHAAYASLFRNTRNYWAGVDYWERSPTFRADLGFEPSNSWHLGQLWFGGIKHFDNNGILENINTDWNLAQKYNFDGVKKDEWVDANLSFNYRAAQTNTHTRYMASNELFGGTQFDGIWLIHNCFTTQPSHSWRFGGYYDYGHRIARQDLVMGKEIVWGLWANVKPIDRLLLSPSLDYISSDNLDTDERLFSQALFRMRTSVQISREFSARLVLQYNDSGDTWEVDPLVTYQINPLTVFYFGSTYNFRDLTLEEDGRAGWAKTGRQYFMKIQYLWQL
jgi:hypothetical protein